VEVASGGFTLVREELRLVRTELFRTPADAVKEKSEAIRIAEATARAIAVDISKPRISAWNKRRSADVRARVDEVVKSCRRKNMLFFTEVERHVAEADIGCVFVNTSTDTEAGAADVNEEPKVPAKVKYEEV
jgi:UDP-glucose 6-dehydrogenase